MLETRKILARIKSIDPIPRVCMRVMELAADDHIVPGELIEEIQTDAGITAKVLKLCNSAYYGFAREIASLNEAGNMLGVNALVNLVLTACAGRYFRDVGGSRQERLEELWEQSVANALAASIVADAQPSVDKNRTYTAALLQDIGRMAIERYFAEQAEEIEECVAAGQPQLTAEEYILGMSHAEMGALLASSWNLPDILIDTIRYHHRPERATVEPVMTCIVQLGGTIAHAVRSGEEDVTKHVGKSALRGAGLDAESLGSLEERLTKELNRAGSFAAV